MLGILLMAVMTLSAKDVPTRYVATWTTAIQKVEPHNLAPAPGLSGNSLRQIVEVSFGGKVVALKLSNEYNTEETEILGVELAEAASQGASSDIKGSSTPLPFKGYRGVTMTPGLMVLMRARRVFHTVAAARWAWRWLTRLRRLAQRCWASLRCSPMACAAGWSAWRRQG